MNYLAHAYLADENDAMDIVGNIYGDFLKGVKLKDLPEGLQQGIRNHQAVDKFTDHHPIVTELKQYFPKDKYRFAPITLDIVFDHFLAKHWRRYHALPLAEFCQKVYVAFTAHHQHMSPQMREVTSYITQQNWLEQYQHLHYIDLVLNRMSKRIRFENQFSGVLADIRPHLPHFETKFHDFFAELVAEFKSD